MESILDRESKKRSKEGVTSYCTGGEGNHYIDLVMNLTARVPHVLPPHHLPSFLTILVNIPKITASKFSKKKKEKKKEKKK